MKKLALVVLVFSLAACGHVSAVEAKQIAYERLSTSTDAPSLHGDALKSALTVSQYKGGTYLVEMRDEMRNLLWAVIVHPSGQSEISRMAIDG